LVPSCTLYPWNIYGQLQEARRPVGTIIEYWVVPKLEV
jgi:hypothetical protein